MRVAEWPIVSHALEVKSWKDGQLHPNCNRLAFASQLQICTGSFARTAATFVFWSNIGITHCSNIGITQNIPISYLPPRRRRSMPSKGEKIQLYGDSGAAAADLVARAAAGTAAVTAVAAAVAAHIRPPHYTTRPPSLSSSHHLTILPPVGPNFFCRRVFSPRVGRGAPGVHT